MYVWNQQYNDTVLTNYMQRSPSGEANYSLANQIPRILWNPVPCNHSMACPQVAGGGTASKYGG
jgi:hypothetical protein